LHCLEKVTEYPQLLYSIWKGDDKDQAWEFYKRTYGEQKPKKPTVIHKLKEIQYSLILTLL